MLRSPRSGTGRSALGHGVLWHVLSGDRPVRLVVMFVRYYVDLSIPARVAEAALVGSGHDWLPTLAAEAEAAGSTLLADVGFGPTPLRIRKAVAITARPLVDLGSSSVLPLIW